MNLPVTKSFIKSLEKVDPRTRSIIKQQVFDFIVDPTAPGFDVHVVLGSRNKGLHSFRVNDDYRVIISRQNGTDWMLHVDHHDKAYAWAEGRTFECNDTTGSWQLYQSVELVEEVTRQVTVDAVFSRYEEQYLLALGVPPPLIPSVRNITEEEFIRNSDRFPEDIAERLFDLIAGTVVPVPDGAAPSAGRSSNGPSRQDTAILTNSEAELVFRDPRAWAIFLHPTQRAITTASFGGPARITGGAGTGKTVVALHRAAHLARRGGPVLLTTFTKALNTHLQRSLDALLPVDDPARSAIRVANIHAIAVEQWRRLFRSVPRFLNDADLQAIIEKHALRSPVAGLSVPFVIAEWNAVVNPNGIESWEEYRRVPRTGRGSAIDARKRRGLWSIFEGVLNALDQAGQTTWSLLCHRVSRSLEASGHQPFHHLIADEAQDFGPGEMKLIRALTKAGGDDLFLAGDGAQSIYRNRFTWLSLGIDIRGRSSRLKVNYRTTEEIRRAADSLVDGAMEIGEATRAARGSISLRSGPLPSIRGFDTRDDELFEVADQIAVLCRDGFAARDILVVARTNALVGEAASTIRELSSLPTREVGDEDWAADDAISFASMHRAKGLEYRVVMIVGCDRQMVPLRAVVNAAVDPQDQESAEEQERQLLYVAMTRAIDRLWISYAGAPSPFLARAGTGGAPLPGPAVT